MAVISVGSIKTAGLRASPTRIERAGNATPPRAFEPVDCAREISKRELRRGESPAKRNGRREVGTP